MLVVLTETYCNKVNIKITSLDSTVRVSTDVVSVMVAYCDWVCVCVCGSLCKEVLP